MIIDSFFVKSRQISIKKTAVPTGILQNPLDLVTMPRPWLSITRNKTIKSQEKKTLIFADQLYKNRVMSDKNSIHKSLVEAQGEGFRILVLSATGKLIDWDGKWFDDNYSLPAEKFTTDVINTLAWKQHALAANRIFTLDYFGINELENKQRNEIHSSAFETNPDAFFRLISTAQFDSYKIKFDSEKAVKRFLALDRLKLLNLLKKIKAIDLSNLDFTKFDFGSLRNILPNLEEINCSESNNLQFTHENLALFNNIKKINLNKIPQFKTSTTDIASAFNKFLKTASTLEELILSKIRHKLLRNCFNGLQTGSLISLKKIDVRGTDLDEGDVIALVKAAPNLEEIYFTQPDSFRSRRADKASLTPALLNVRKIVCDGLKKATTKMFVTPNLKEMELFTQPALIKDQPVSFLNKIKKIVIASGDNIDDLSAVLKVARNLEELTAECLLASRRRLENPIANSLMKLRKINLTHTGITEDSLIALFRAAPELTEVGITDGFELNGRLTELAKDSLKKLKKITLNSETITADDLLGLFNAAPNLEEINIDSCRRLAGSFKDLPAAHLKLKKLYLPFNYELATAVTLLQATPNLEYISDANDWTDLINTLAPDSLSKLRKIKTPTNNLTPENVEALFKIAPMLEVIWVWPSAKSLVTPSIKKIRKINFEYANISTNDIVGIVKLATELKEISFIFCDLAFLQSLTKNALKNIKKIRFTGNNPIRLDVLSHAAPDLEELDFTGVLDWADLRVDRLSPCSFKNLKKIYFHNSNRDRNFVAKLQAAAPNAAIIGVNEISKKADKFLKNELLIKNGFFNTTQERDLKLKFTRYFPRAHPSEYRLYISSPDLNSLERFSPFPPDDFEPYTLKAKDYFSNSSFNCKEGAIAIELTDGKQIILPSLDAEEELFDLYVLNEQGNLVSPERYQIKHSDGSRFYKIIMRQPGDYSVNFQVAIPVKPTLSPMINDLVNKYKAYQPEATNPKIEFKNLKEGAEYIRANKTGRCELRALAAYDELKEQYKDRVRIVYNDIHAFVEINEYDPASKSSRWHNLQLGGYVANLEEVRKNIKKLAAKINIFEPALNMLSYATDIVLAPALYSWLAIFDVLTLKNDVAKPVVKVIEKVRATKIQNEIKAEEKLTQEKVISESLHKDDEEIKINNFLMLSNSDVGLRDFYSELREQEGSNNIFIAQRLEDINITGYGMTAAGKTQRAYTALSIWLKNRERGTFVVDIRDFDGKEIAQLNDLLDHNLENQIIPPDIRIILLDKPDRGHYGVDFLRRVNTDKKILAHSSETSLLTDNLATENQQGTIAEIDLFDSLYWQTILIGNWQLENPLGDDTFSLQYQKGRLLKLAEENKAQHIVFKNPPLDDPTFTAFVAELQGLRRISWADQSQPVADEILFSKKTGYDWAAISSQASLQVLTGEEATIPYILSDSNILLFVQDTCYEFSDITDKLEVQDSWLKRCKTGTIDVLCAPDLSEGAIAQLLTAAKEQNIKVRFVAPSLEKFPVDSTLHKLNLPIAKQPQTSMSPPPNVIWQLHEDVYFAASKILNEQANCSCFELSSLDPAELARFPLSTDSLSDDFLKHGKFALHAPLSAILKKLLAGETVLLTGTIPSSLYTALTSLSLGFIEGKRFKGKLIILTPPEEASLAEVLTGQSLVPIRAGQADKVQLLKRIIPKAIEIDAANDINSENNNFAAQERLILQSYLTKHHESLTGIKYLPLKPEGRCKQIDLMRIHDINQALEINAWAMLEGETGVGKTHLLKNILPKKTTFFKFEDWLTATPTNNEKIILVIDEANFQSELSAKGVNFLERFKSLHANPPGILWKGVYYPLTAQHKVIFAFNPASYGAGRSEQGILSEQALSVSLKPLPSFYLIERVIKPLVTHALNHKKHPPLSQEQLDSLSAPINTVYAWILKHSTPDQPLITPREMKAMVNLVVNKIISNNIQSEVVIERLATEIAYEIGKQCLNDNAVLLTDFNTVGFKPTHTILNTLERKPLPKEYKKYQSEAYQLVQDFLDARDNVLSSENTDLGLGGIVLEGGTGIGKTHFINQIKEDYENTYPNKKTYYLSATTLLPEKIRILHQAFKEGALVFANELNLGTWPNEILNSYLMGFDKEGKKADHPGFLLIATQNPASFERDEDDPALRHRVFKMNLEWPTYRKKPVHTNEDKRENMEEIHSVKGKKKSHFSESSTVFSPVKQPRITTNIIPTKKNRY